ncbi:MAG: HDOD domain-containing protein, partial [Candidatus Zixiibacteriota bacterium]
TDSNLNRYLLRPNSHYTFSDKDRNRKGIMQMNSVTPQSIIAQIHEIGSLPQSLAVVLKVINDQHATADRIADAISKDVSLTTRVLKMVNSAHYRRSGKVTKISEAVLVMGLNSIRMLTLSSSVFGMIPDSDLSAKFDIRRIWRHLIETGTAAKAIAKEIGYPEPEEAFIAGILHDVGIIIMLLYFKNDYINAINMVQSTNLELSEVEEETFGFNHCELGAELIAKFRLPQNLVFATANHHNIENESVFPEETELNYLIALADCLSNGPIEDMQSNIEENIRLIKNVCDRINLGYEKIDDIRRTSLMQSIALAEYLELDVSNILDMLTEANEQLASLYNSVETMMAVKQRLFSGIPGEIMDKVQKKKKERQLI